MDFFRHGSRIYDVRLNAKEREAWYRELEEEGEENA